MLGATWKMLTDTFNEWSADKAPRLGAAIAYYSVFSIAPLVILVIGIAGLVFGEEAAQGELVQQISQTIGPSAAKSVQDLVAAAHQEPAGPMAMIIGLAMLFFGASGVFLGLQDALNTIWKVQPKPGRGILGIIKDRLLSFSIILGAGFLLLVSLVVSAVLAGVSKVLSPEALPGGTYLWMGVNLAISFVIITLLFAMIFKILPDAEIAWRDVWIGAAATTGLFLLGKFLLGIYLGQSSVTSTYGAAGTLVVLLLWVYYSSLIVLFGAEFTRVYANCHGSRIMPTANAEFVSPEQRRRQGMPHDGAIHCAENRPTAVGGK